MLRFLLRRTLRVLATLVVIAALVFVVLHIIPGDPALVIAGVDAKPADIEAIRHTIGSDRSVPEQFASFVGGLVRLDLGTSVMSSQPVAGLIAERLPITITLAFLGMILALCIALPLGIAAAARRGGFFDGLSAFVSQIGMSVPSFWLGILLLLGFAFAIPIFPLFGADTPLHFVLPSLTLGIGEGAVLMRLVRASVLEELSKEYVIAARAKGLSNTQILRSHVLKNALPPVLMLAGIQFGGLLGGAVIVEQVFSLPGLGRLLLNAVASRDFPVIQGCVMVLALVFSLTSWIADVLAALANPRITLR